MYGAVSFPPGVAGHIDIARNDLPAPCSWGLYKTEHLTLNDGGKDSKPAWKEMEF